MSPINNLIDSAEDYEDGEKIGARRFFDTAESLFDLFGMDTAADNLRRYRSGEGGTRSYSKEEMSAHPAYGEAIDRNRTYFEGRTFTGKMGNSDNNKRLLGLNDGEIINFNDGWDANIYGSRPSTYLAFGRTAIRSNGNFEATRNGGRLVIQGAVENRLGTEKKATEAFDFNLGQIGDRQARALEGAGEARPYEILKYGQKQAVEAELQYEPDGSLTLLRSTWGDME